MIVADTSRPRIAVLGVGHVGTALTRILLDAGYDVTVAASGDPERIRLIATVLMPRAEVRWAREAVAEADVVILAIPLHRFPGLDHSLFDGKLVIDTMNYWAPTDGVQPLFDTDAGSSEVVQTALAGATVVKTFNHIGYHEMEEDRLPVGAGGRRALGVASSEPAAAATVAAIIDAAGYDAVVFDALEDGRAFEPGGPVFGARLTAPEFEHAVEATASAEVAA